MEFDVDEIKSTLIHQSTLLKNYVHTIGEEDLLKILHLKTSWVEGDLARYEFLQHAFNHSSYHRGQIITIGRNIDITDPPMTDYNYYNMNIKPTLITINT